MAYTQFIGNECLRYEEKGVPAVRSKDPDKMNEPIYSKGLAQYFISDIIEDDIVCTVGTEEAKFVLFDDFACISEGEYLGPVSHDIIKQMRKEN